MSLRELIPACKLAEFDATLPPTDSPVFLDDPNSEAPGVLPAAPTAEAVVAPSSST